MLSIIVAVAENNVIGKDNDLIWKLPRDMKHFKETTTGHYIIMGRKTFESLPKGPLPNRTNIVLSKNKDFKYDISNNIISLDSISFFIELEERNVQRISDDILNLLDLYNFIVSTNRKVVFFNER